MEVKDDPRDEKRVVDGGEEERANRPEKQPRLERLRNERDPLPLRKVVCHGCGEPGHIRPACPQRGRKQVLVCHNCRKEGHKIADCTEPRKQCKWGLDCPTRNCAYYHPPSRSPSRSADRKRRSRDRSPRKAVIKVQQQSIRVTGLRHWLGSAELGGLFPGSDVVAGAMTDEHAAVVIFRNERERDEALQTANKMIFERL